MWGHITFGELHSRTYKIVANKLRQHGFSNPYDIEDCMQSAYLKVWMKLQDTPEMYVGKSLNYLVQSLYFHSKAQRFSHQRHYQKIAYNTDLEPIERNQISSQRIETWIDFQIAISAVVELIKDIPHAIFALYSLITDVKVSDIQQMLGCSISTMTRYRKQVREQLAQHLPHYHHAYQNENRISNFNLISISVAYVLLATT